MSKKKKLLVALICVVLCIAAVATVILIDRRAGRTTLEITQEEAQEILDRTLSSLPLKQAEASVKILEKTKVQVNDISYGYEKDIILHCSYETVDVLSVYQQEKQNIFSTVYAYYAERTAAGKMVSGTTILAKMRTPIANLMENASPVAGELDIILYDTGAESPVVWLDDATVDTLLGGLLSVRNDVNETTSVRYEGEEVSIQNNNTLRRGIGDCFGLNNYTSDKPDASTPLVRAWNSFCADFHKNFIKDQRWKYLTSGLGTTLAITGLALLLGTAIGFLTAIIRTTHDKQGKLSLLNAICRLYVTIIRGTPVMIQLMIIYFVLLLPIGIEKFPAAVLCFGLNSGAYVSEIFRGGIMAVDGGQMEAGRSLGFGYVPTMIYVILPQAFKAVLPSLCNEFISLLKETSVAFYIGVADLTMGGLKIRSLTYSNFMPLIAIAVIYLVLVLILTKLVSILEKKLRKSER